MKVTLLSLTVLCAISSALSLVAAQEPQPVQTSQQNIESVYKQSDKSAFASYKEQAAAFALLCHNRLAVNSQFYGLPTYDLRLICSHLKELWKYRCSLCTFTTMNRMEFLNHFHPTIKRDASGDFVRRELFAPRR